jgi:hypothetical protein
MSASSTVTRQQSAAPIAPSAHDLAFSMLCADRLASRLPPDDLHHLADIALADGRAQADCAALQWGRDPCEIAAHLAIPVIDCWSNGGYGTTVVFAEYVDRPLHIVLYRHAIADLDRRMADSTLRDALPDTRCGPIFLAHELYHHLDRNALNRSLMQRHRIVLFQVGTWRWTGALATLEEIAAGSFAQTLLQLPFHPRLIELVCLLDGRADYTSSITASGRAVNPHSEHSTTS